MCIINHPTYFFKLCVSLSVVRFRSDILPDKLSNHTKPKAGQGMMKGYGVNG